jgi:hypothetical protein
MPSLIYDVRPLSINLNKMSICYVSACRVRTAHLPAPFRFLLVPKLYLGTRGIIIIRRIGEICQQTKTRQSKGGSIGCEA